MNQFFSDLTPRQSKVLTVAVFAVVLALFDRLLVGPMTAKLTAVDDTIESEKNAIKSDLRFLIYKNRILKEGKIFEPYFTDAIPKEEEAMAAFLEKLDNLVVASGLTKIKNNRSNDEQGQSTASKDFLVYKVDLECSGDLENIAKLMYAIDTSREFLKILKFNLAMKKTGDAEEMRAVMTVAKYIVPSDNALLASLSAPNAISKTAGQQAAQSR